MRSCCFSPDGEQMVIALNDCTAKLFNLETGRCERTFTGHTGGAPRSNLFTSEDSKA